jgi:hypothetical protein
MLDVQMLVLQMRNLVTMQVTNNVKIMLENPIYIVSFTE